jgi:hypothetical protein
MSEYSQNVVKKARSILEDKQFNLVKQEEELSQRSIKLDWIFFAFAYLDLAKLGCQHILKEEGYLPQKSFLIAAVLYNFKHSLEIIIKLLTFLLDDKYEKDHSLKKLFENFKKIASKRMNEEERKKINKLIDRMYVLIFNYYYLRFLGDKIGGSSTFIIDEKNDFLRYPENNVKIQIGYWSIIDKISKTEIHLIKNDIDTAEEVFVQIRKTLKISK